jgi:NADP-dependent 3-hydroxy acid dehydrogenase YdfG
MNILLCPSLNCNETHFFTATTAARHMTNKGAGVIMAITAQAGRKPYRDGGGCASSKAFVASSLSN